MFYILKSVSDTEKLEATHTRFQVTMSKTTLVHETHAFEELLCDLSSSFGGEWRCIPHKAIEISERHILQGDKDRLCVLEPPEAANEMWDILLSVTLPYVLMCGI